MTSTAPERVRGATVGSYELLDRIGAGGMGEVWKARDRVLDRLVALKFLTGPASPKRDLLHEARAASALSHPNIVTVFQIGESDGDTYLAMEFVEGVSLRHHIGGPHDVGEALGISEQIVDGLATAHQRGIIHRDLKPENIMIRDDGRVKLVDFGLAKHLSLDDASTHDSVSKSGELVGTCSYMSPEQARGTAITPASDVFSLGIVMYELFSGKHPFRQEAVLDTLNAIVRVEPPPLKPADAPQPLMQIVSRALQKEPTHRYLSAVEISEPLRQARREWNSDSTRAMARQPAARASSWWKWAPVIASIAIVASLAWLQFGPVAPGEGTSPIRSMAVMPFRSADQNAALITESLPEDIGSALTKAGFQVASRTSAMQMGAAPDARAAALSQNIDGVLDGTIRVQGSSVRIYVELVNTRTGFQVWSGTFTSELAALMSGPSPAVEEIASQVRGIAGGRR